jgi:16S rRNA (cytosine967-C5)-methyltransferase
MYKVEKGKMRNLFQKVHLFAFLKQFDQVSKPLDLAWSDYQKAHKNLGSHDRREIGDAIYTLIRWKELFDYLGGGALPWENRYHLWHQTDLFRLPDHTPLAIRCGGSQWLFQKLAAYHGKTKAGSICRALNEPAPVTIRVNRLKTNRDCLLTQWQGIGAIACQWAKDGIRFHQRIALTTLPEFKKGLFEIQDEGSQLVASLIRAEPGDHVLDYCSGSGGKSLAIAPDMNGRGQIYLHDIRPAILQQARLRLRRAGIQNAQFLSAGDPSLQLLKRRMDWVLVDAPCSGTGTYRRNPDMKWKADDAMLTRLVDEQRKIFAQALEFVRPGGKIVYATCSLLQEENEQQADFFLKNFSIESDGAFLKIEPELNGPDGFFGACFVMKPSL